jgi:hypothetical protein
MKFGSHLYGTDTAESDTDYKGVFLPSKEEILLGKIPKSINLSTKENNHLKNNSGDVDTEIYSLHYFIKLACDGETVALDMLHADLDFIYGCEEGSYSIIWKDIVKERSRFYTKNLKAFIGYARKQAAKYGVKGSRLNDAKNVLDFISGLMNSLPGISNTKIKRYWDILPKGEHIYKIPEDEKGIRIYQVCGRKIQDTSSLLYAYNIIKTFYDNYGHRAKKAANNEGIDWKAVSHAYRAAFQLKQIYTEGTITFPLKEAEFLKKIKSGQLDYLTVAGPGLDDLITEVEELSDKSDLPETVDRKYWDNFIINVLKEEMELKW